MIELMEVQKYTNEPGWIEHYFQNNFENQGPVVPKNQHLRINIALTFALNVSGAFAVNFWGAFAALLYRCIYS